MISQVCFLGSPTATDHSFGKKAENLHRLVKAGLSIPSGFVIPPDLDLSIISTEQWLTWIEQIGGFPVAVRSSGNLEDLSNASFAGQYESYLNVNQINQLQEKVRKVRATAHSDLVKSYLSKKGIDSSTSQVSVLVQKMVSAKIAGVGFSIHPMTGNEEHALIEFCKGFGDQLVSGMITPSRLVVRLEDAQTVKISHGSEQIQLKTEWIKKLIQELINIQAYFGSPQDIEWAIDEMDRLWILQSRPITQISWRSDVEEFTNADFKDGGVSARVCTPLMYSLYRDTIQSTLPKYLKNIRLLSRKETSKNKERRWIDYFYGRPYWNASAIKQCLSSLPGFDEEVFDQDLGIQKDYGPKGPVRVPNTLKTILPAIPIAIAVEDHYKTQLKETEKFGEYFEKREAYFLSKVKNFNITSNEEFYSDLKLVLSDFYPWTEGTYFTTIYNNSNIQTHFKDLIRKLDKKTNGKTSLVKLMSGLSDICHLDMQRGLLTLYQTAKNSGFEGKEWNYQLQRFLEKNYFHADAELELRTPRWGEVPERVKEIVRGMVKSQSKPNDPDESIIAQKREYEEEVIQVRKRIRFLKNQGQWMAYVSLANAFEKHLKRMRIYLSRREEMREYSTRCYYVVRQFILEAGRRLAKEKKLSNHESIWMLHTDEILSLVGDSSSMVDGSSATGGSSIVDGSSDFQFNHKLESKILFRKKMYEGYRNFTPPNELGHGVKQRDSQSFSEVFDGVRVMSGVGCSPGVVEGVARVIHSLSQIDEIQNGDILVTKFTDPGWTPALGLVSGVVTEVGGMLSHAAVISREYGIPAVLNLPDATREILTGMKVRLDGTTGRVEFIN